MCEAVSSSRSASAAPGTRGLAATGSARRGAALLAVLPLEKLHRRAAGRGKKSEFSCCKPQKAGFVRFLNNLEYKPLINFMRKRKQS